MPSAVRRTSKNAVQNVKPVDTDDVYGLQTSGVDPGSHREDFWEAAEALGSETKQDCKSKIMGGLPPSLCMSFTVSASISSCGPILHTAAVLPRSLHRLLSTSRHGATRGTNYHVFRHRRPASDESWNYLIYPLAAKDSLWYQAIEDGSP